MGYVAKIGGGKIKLGNGKFTVSPAYTKETIDLYIIAGQSNAHGHAKVSTLTSSQSAQEGFYYSSWHHDTSNAETTQYYSSILNYIKAGSTRGDSNKSTLGGSTDFGPELGFVSKANSLNLANGRPIGIVKYAVGASALLQNANLSDWDINATTYRNGDCWRGFKRALADAKFKLDSAGYNYQWKGMIWWQGESGTSVTGLSAFVSAFRNLMGTTYGVANSSQFPVVITGNSTGWGSTLEAGVAYPDPYIGFIDAASYGQVYIGGSFNTHPGDTILDYDVDDNGVNDMFNIGEAYADEMVLALSGNTSTGWQPDSASAKLWADASQITGSSGDSVTSFADRVAGVNWNVVGSATIGTQNGKNVIAFSPTQDTDYLQSASSITTSTGRQIWYLVARPEGVNSNQDSLWSQVGGNAITLLPNSSVDYYGRMYHAGRLVNASNISTTNLEGTYSLFAFDWDPDNDTVKTYFNGTLKETFNTQTQGSFDLTMASSATYRFMSQYGAPTPANILDGYFAEAIITTDTTNHQKTEGYLAWKWGLESMLPSGHPYKNYKP